MGAVRQPPHRCHRVVVEEDVGALRRAVGALVAGVHPAPRGREDLRPGAAELVATELATNIVRHTTTGGYVLCRLAGESIEFLAVDHGPGIRSEALFIPPSAGAHGGQASLSAFRGAGPGGGLGVGLGAVRRHTSAFDAYSGPGGTVILARLGRPVPVPAGRWRWGGVNIPLGGDGESGDAWAVDEATEREGVTEAVGGVIAPQNLAALVVDGLGHGPAAAAAARAAVSVFEQSPSAEPGDFLRRAHEAMRGTRGGVLGTCVINGQRGELTYAGVGNITARVLSLDGSSRSLLGRDGTVGTQLALPGIHPVTYRWVRGATVVLASDGISSRWDSSRYPGLLRHDPAVIAAVLHRDHQRGNDDATVLVVKDAPDQDTHEYALGTSGHHIGEIR